MSKAQIDGLGDRLRRGEISDADLRDLDQYRRLFAPAYSVVISRLRAVTSLEPTGRPAKSTSAIIEKLRRESVRLSQIQDIAGVRIVVDGPSKQTELVALLSDTFENSTLSDRRDRPSHGYRAVHIIVSVDGFSVEIQIRTPLQHRWAELSEKLADLLDPAIKYGGGAKEVRTFLAFSSESIASIETMLIDTMRLRREVEELASMAPDILEAQAPELRDQASSNQENVERLVAEAMGQLDDLMQFVREVRKER